MKKNKISALAKQYGVVLGFVLLICIGALLSETFLSAQNLINILKQYAPIVVISCGTTLVIISGQIDLGAGSVVALSGCISVSTYLHTHSLALAILAALCVGVLTGLINGFVITYYKLAPLIVTLAMQFMARGGALMFTNGIPLTLDDGFKVIGQGTLGFVPIAVVIMLAAIIGGVSFNGGIGNGYGSLVGCLIVGVLSNILNMLNVSPYMQQTVKGLIIILAVIAQRAGHGDAA